MNNKLITPFEFKLSTKEPGTFTGLANVVGIVDLQGDRTMPGAFDRDLAERGSTRPILWMYDPGSPIGTASLDIDARGNLAVKSGRLVLEVQKGAEAYALLKAAAISGISIGYEVIKHRWNAGVRELMEVKLHEISLVSFPANEASRVEAVKQLEELKAVRDALRTVESLQGDMALLLTLDSTRRHLAEINALLRRR